MIKKLIIFALLSVGFVSCGVDYDGEKRLVFETHLIDQNNAPIAGKHIRIQAVTGDGNTIVFGDGDREISGGYTDGNGNIRLVFPAPLGAQTSINILYDEDPVYQFKYINGVKVDHFQNFKLNFSPLKLYKKSELVILDILPVRGTEQTEIINIKFEGLFANEYFNFTSQQPIMYYNPLSRKVVENQNVTLKYTVVNYNNSPPTQTQHTEVIAVGEESLNYSFIYNP